MTELCMGYATKLMELAEGDTPLVHRYNVELYDALDVATTLYFRAPDGFNESGIIPGNLGLAIEHARFDPAIMCHIMGPRGEEHFYQMYYSKGAIWNELSTALATRGSRFHACIYRKQTALNVVCGSLHLILFHLMERDVLQESAILPGLKEFFDEEENVS